MIERDLIIKLELFWELQIFLKLYSEESFNHDDIVIKTSANVSSFVLKAPSVALHLV